MNSTYIFVTLVISSYLRAKPLVSPILCELNAVTAQDLTSTRATAGHISIHLDKVMQLQASHGRKLRNHAMNSNTPLSQLTHNCSRAWHSTATAIVHDYMSNTIAYSSHHIQWLDSTANGCK
jgi:hypothetical protein